MAFYELKAELAGMIAKIEKGIGDAISVDDTVMILESMKMEIPVLSPRRGRLHEISVVEGQAVQEGDALALLELA
ncbi:MAG: acetyl-CoA carboxylase biotin carboxyl carrier protein subunit [Alphaproteobacteria bacterium]